MGRHATTNDQFSPDLFWAAALLICAISFGCESKIEVEKVDATKTAASATALKPITAIPGDVVTIRGIGFKSNRQKNFVKITNSNGDEITAPATVMSDTEATFVMPEGVGLGLTSVVIESNGKQLTGPMSFVANLADNALPILIDDAAEICSTKQYIDKNGDIQTGIKNCSGSTIDLSNLTAGNIKSGVTINGVTGTLTPAPANCSTDGATGCVTTSSFKAANMTNVTAGNIKSGVTIAGQLGAYPSATNPLPGASGTADLDAATFHAKVKSSTAFEYWDSAGARQTGAGDADILAANIASGVDIFNTTGTFTGTAPNAWDVRVGAVVNGVTGKLKVNCRNRANPTVFDIDQGQAATITTGSPGSINITAHGLANNTMVRINYLTAPTGLNNSTIYYVVNAAANTFNVSTTSGGAAINMTTVAGANVTVHKWQPTPQVADIWDTIDDYNNNTSGLPGTVISGWTNNDCGGVEASAGDDNVWKDVTTNSGGAASNCAADAARCTMQDKITGLWWSKQQTDATWWQAVSGCQNLNHNGQSGWRLPTQKELMDAYNHGIRSAASDKWATGANNDWIMEAAMRNAYFWSASSLSSFTDSAWSVWLAYGYTNINAKKDPFQVVCVR
jgi:hypothetical protein